MVLSGNSWSRSWLSGLDVEDGNADVRSENAEGICLCYHWIIRFLAGLHFNKIGWTALLKARIEVSQVAWAEMYNINMNAGGLEDQHALAKDHSANTRRLFKKIRLKAKIDQFAIFFNLRSVS